MADFLPVQEQVAPAPAEQIAPQQRKELAGQAVQGGQEFLPQPGMPSGAGQHMVSEDPLSAPDEEASEEEQRAYEDLFARTMAMVNDVRKPPKGKRSMADEVTRMLATKGKEAYIAIGDVAGLLMTQMVDNAKRQGVEYPGTVIQEVGLDLVLELTRIARDSGAIANMPEEDSPEHEKLMELSALQAAKFYGEYMIKTGQADQQGHRAELDEQIQREADSGQLEDWGMEEMDPNMRDALADQTGGFVGGR